MTNETITDKFYTYRFVSDFAVISFAVAGKSDWTDEMFDDSAWQELGELVKDDTGYYVDDCWEMELP